MSFDSPTLATKDGSHNKAAEFVVVDNTLQVQAQESTTDSDSTFMAMTSCFEEWLANFVLAFGSEALVCLPVGLANPVAGAVCALAMMGITGAIDTSGVCR